MFEIASKFRKSIAFLVLSISYALLFGMVIQPWFLDVISEFGKTKRSILVLIATTPTWIFFACSLANYYETKNAK